MNQKLKNQLRKVLWITFGWTLVSMIQFAVRYSAIQGIDCNCAGPTTWFFFGGSVLTGIVAGLLGGSGVVFLWEAWLRSRDYGRALVSIFLSYCMIYFIVSVVTNLFFFIQGEHLNLKEQSLWEQIMVSIGSPSQWISFFFWLLVVVGTLLLLQVNDKYGPGVFREFILGKYFNPKREERIFMFLDLRSSTTIAEKLGEVNYFNFLNDVFKHSTPSILHNKGEIYQYVGDEIVISWKMDKGLNNANCLRCFFDVQIALRQKADYYLAVYNVQPEFKAGLHYGHVMAGEIGVVKRDIVFSGDVLNTTARIQSKCNELGVNVLISKFLLEKLDLPPHTYAPERLGDMMLRGKQQKVVLYTV